MGKIIKACFLLNPFFSLLFGCLFYSSQPILAGEIDLPPEIQENSPVLQRWLQKTPNVLEEIKQQPRFSSRFRFGYNQYSTDFTGGGWFIGVEDIGLNRGRLTFSANYQDSTSGEFASLGVQAQYYLLPLGQNVNIAPVLGYRYLQIGDYTASGANIGVRLVLVLSSRGAADIFVTQSFILAGNEGNTWITNVSVGYALTPRIRLSTDIEQQNSSLVKDTRWGIVIEVLR